MCKLSKENQIDRRNLKCDFIGYSPSKISAINTPISQIFINLPRESSVIILLNGYIELHFDVLHAAIGNRYADGDNVRLVILGPIALFSNYNLSTGSGKLFEEISHAHIVSLMYKQLASNGGFDDMSIGFDRSCNRRKQMLTNNKKIKSKYHVRIYLKDVFLFVENHETATYGLGYNFTLTRLTDNAVLNEDNTTNNAKIQINASEWYVPFYSPNREKFNKLMNQITKKTPKELHYPEKSVFMKEVNTQKHWTYELGTQEGVNVPIWIYVVFQQSNRQHDQNLNNDTF